MAEKRDATTLSEFVKFTNLGAAIFGVIVRQGQNGNGDFVIMSPAGYRPGVGEKFNRYEEVAVGLSTDLANKVTASDVGKIMLFVFAGRRPTTKDPLKVFNVYELTAAEAKELMTTSKLAPEWEKVPQDAVNGPLAGAAKAPAPF